MKRALARIIGGFADLSVALYKDQYVRMGVACVLGIAIGIAI